MRRFYFIPLWFSVAAAAFGGLTWETTYREVRIPATQKEVLADFPFKNPAAVPVDISSLQTSCGCTVAKVDQKEIPGGGSGVVHVRFDVGGRKGEQVKSVVVKTSDRAKQTLVLRVLIQESVSLSQKELFWSSGTPAMTQESIIEVDPASGARILGVESLNDQFDARLEELEPGRRYRLAVTPRSTQVPVAGSVKISVADPGKRSVFVQTRVED